MPDLFESLDDLKPFIFRITDNGGESADRFTIVTCDGDYYGASTNPFDPQGVGMWGEGIDVQGMADRVEAGTERDLRWIDLPENVRRAVMGSLNQGFADYLESAPAAPDRESALDYQGWADMDYTSRRNRERGIGPTESIYCKGEGFAVRRDDLNPPYGDDGDPEFATFREALLYTLPDDCELAGPEYHTTVDLWDEEGGPAALWDREAEPPVIDPAYHKIARVVICHEPEQTPPAEQLTRVAWFATVRDAENYLGTSAGIDPDDLAAGRYTIDDLDDPDAG